MIDSGFGYYDHVILMMAFHVVVSIFSIYLRFIFRAGVPVYTPVSQILHITVAPMPIVVPPASIRRKIVRDADPHSWKCSADWNSAPMPSPC